MFIRLIYAAAVAVACCLAVLATFLPWVSFSVRLPIVGTIGTITRHGYEGDGIITLLLGLIALGFAAYLWFERSAAVYRLVTVFNSLLGAIILGTAVVNLIDSERALGDAQRQLGLDLEALVGIDPQSLVDAGAGVYVAIAAGAILTTASLLAFSAEQLLPEELVEPDTGSDPEGSVGACSRCGTLPPAGGSYCLNCGRG